MKTFQHRIFADPRFTRAAIGFDRVFDLIEGLASDACGNFPPYDIEKTGADGFRITLALAGYAESELSVETESDVLTVKGTKAQEEGEREFIHRGIASRSFERKFHLADHVEVKSASYANGLLVIELQREIPDAKKPRKFDLGQPAPEAQAATA